MSRRRRREEAGRSLACSSSACVLVPEWLLLAVAAAAIAARLYLRLALQKKRLTASDMLMCCAWVAAAGSAAFDIKFATMGVLDAGNVDNFTVEDLEYTLQLFWVSYFPFYTAFYLCKAALLTFYAPLFPVFMSKRRAVLWSVCAYTAVSFVVTIVLNLSLCDPIWGNWALDSTDMCVGDTGAIVFHVSWSLHFSSDIVLFMLPFLVLHSLNLSRTVKIAVYSVFLLGLINLTFCLARFLVLELKTDMNFDTLSLIELFSAIDLNLSLVIVCLPSLRPYVRASTKSKYDRSDPPAKLSGGTRKKAADETTFSELHDLQPISGSAEIEEEDGKSNGAGDNDLVQVRNMV